MKIIKGQNYRENGILKIKDIHLRREYSLRVAVGYNLRLETMIANIQLGAKRTVGLIDWGRSSNSTDSFETSSEQGRDGGGLGINFPLR